VELGLGVEKRQLWVMFTTSVSVALEIAYVAEYMRKTVLFAWLIALACECNMGGAEEVVCILEGEVTIKLYMIANPAAPDRIAKNQ
jgi:hypothetical protein